MGGLTLSEPAKSTKWNFDVIFADTFLLLRFICGSVCSGSFSLFSSGSSIFVCFSTTENMACDRDDTEFISVDATVRHREPFCNCLLKM